MSNNTHKTVYFNGGDDSDSSDAESHQLLEDTQEDPNINNITEQTDNMTGGDQHVPNENENSETGEEDEPNTLTVEKKENNTSDDDDDDNDNASDSSNDDSSMNTNDIISIHPLQLILSRFLTTNIDEKNTTTQRTITNVLEDILSELKSMNKNLNEIKQ